MILNDSRTVFFKNSNWRQTLLLAAIFLSPILVSTSKAGGAIYTLLFLVGLFAAWPAWKKLEVWEKRFLTIFALFCLPAILSMINTQDLHTGFSKLERFLYFPLIIPSYLLVRRLGVETSKSYLAGAFVATFVFLGQALYQTKIQGLEHAEGAYHKIVFGDIAILMAVILISAAIVLARTRRHYLMAGISIGASVVASILSEARGSWLFLIIAIVCLLWLYRERISAQVRFALIGASFAFVGIGFFWQHNFVTQHIEKGISEVESYLADPTRVSSWGDRLNMWHDAITMWRESPLLGTGIGDFRGDTKTLIAEGRSSAGKLYDHAHSIYFDALATMGIIGLVSVVVIMLWIPFSMFYRLWKSADSRLIEFYALAGMMVVLGFAVFGLSEGWLSRNAMVKTYLTSILVFMSSIAIAKERIGIEKE